MIRNVFFVILIFISIVLFSSCGGSKKVTQPPAPPVVSAPVEKPLPTPPPIPDAGDKFFEDIFRKYPGQFEAVLKHREDWNVQVIYTQVNRDSDGKPQLRSFYFNGTNPKYFYPASTVKLPVALLALQRLKELAGKGITRKTTMTTEINYAGQTAQYNDPNTPDGKPSIEQYIKKIFLVSDNNAYNRLYEFLGQEYINNELQKKGFSSAQILHRLDVFLTEDQNRHTNPIKFFDDNNALIYSIPGLLNQQAYGKRNDYIGKSYFSNGNFIERPMVFSNKNRLSLADLNRILQAVVFPGTVKPSERFNISDDDRNFVLKYMSEFPSESTFPYYDSSFHKASQKFLMYGGNDENLRKNIRIFNKVGDAYGQLVDVAYVVDYENKIEFMLSAAIYCNQDGILNDDKYDYDSIGLPFLKNLGSAIYDYERNRKKNYLPDLSSLIFSYDK
jgi:hypothetical protein